MMQSSSMYKEHILALWKEPENFGELEGPTHKRHGRNESCGDDVTMFLIVKDGKVFDVKFKGQGCALCMASASMATEKIKGMPVEDVLKMGSKELLEMLEIEVHPARLSCILLPLETIQKALREEDPEES